MAKGELKENIKEFVWKLGKYILIGGGIWAAAAFLYPILPFGGELSNEAIATIIAAGAGGNTLIDVISTVIETRSHKKIENKVKKNIKEQEERHEKELSDKDKEITELKRVNEENVKVIEGFKKEVEVLKKDQEELIKLKKVNEENEKEIEELKKEVETLKKEQGEIVVTAGKLIVEGERLKVIAENASEDLQKKLTEKYGIIEKGLTDIANYRK